MNLTPSMYFFFSDLIKKNGSGKIPDPFFHFYIEVLFEFLALMT